PTEVHVRWGKHNALESLAAKMGFTIMVCDELRELSAVKEDMAKYMRSAFDALRAGAAWSTV
ncbi:MAG: hypothetical protein Q7J64_04545, partial [Elusimicrobiota bacterium]|nr:hypothetical protein [Elusimicrobiota bacterium]